MLLGKVCSRTNCVFPRACDTESPACRLLMKVMFMVVVSLVRMWKTSPKSYSHGHLKSVSVTVFWGAQGGASCAYFWVTGGFLLLLFLLFSPALWRSSLHSQVVDPVGFWVGDFAERDFVDGWVVWIYQQKEERGEAEGPGAQWQPNLGGERTDGQVYFDTLHLRA